MLLESLGALDAPQRHEQQRQQGRSQAVEGRADLAIDLMGDAEDATGHEHRHGAEHSRTRHGLGVAEHGCRVVEHAEAGQQTIPCAVHRVHIEAHPNGLWLSVC